VNKTVSSTPLQGHDLGNFQADEILFTLLENVQINILVSKRGNRVIKCQLGSDYFHERDSQELINLLQTVASFRLVTNPRQPSA